MEQNKLNSEYLPSLTQAAFYILLALANQERHGYAIIKEVTRNTNGRVRLGPGTLYRSIQRLLADGLIEETEVDAEPKLEDERRRYYRLTALGHTAVTAEVEHLEQVLRVAQTKQLLNQPQS